MFASRGSGPAVRVPLLPRHDEDSDCAFKMLFLGYRIPRIALESSSALGDVCLRVWILTLEGMFCFRVCLGKEHARSELRAHRDESQCLGYALVCSYSRGMRNKAFVSCGAVPPLPRHSFSVMNCEIRTPSLNRLLDITDTTGLL